MRIGSVEIPDVILPDNMQDIFHNYIQQTGDSCSYVAMYGVEHPELLLSSGIDPNLVWLYAATEYLKENPTNGLAVFHITDVLATLGDLKGVIMALESLEAAGSPGCYHEVWYEDPAFRLGWYLASFKRYEPSIASYRRSLGKREIKDHWHTWIHLGTVYHETREFDLAKQCYQEALKLIEADFFEVNPSSKPINIRTVQTLIEQTNLKNSFEGRRTEDGVDLS